MKSVKAPSFISEWANKATWSLEEAAYLLDERNPDLGIPKLDATSTNQPSQIFFWLKKEQGKGKLSPIGGTQGRFSPGTIMRYCRDNSDGKYIPPQSISDAYDKKGKPQPGPGYANRLAKEYYVDAANLIFKTNSMLTVAVVADFLVDLHKAYVDVNGSCPFRYKSHVTIRRYIASLRVTKPGRPKKSDLIEPNIELTKIVKELIAKTDLSQ